MTGAWEATEQTIPAGSLVIPMDQPLARLAFILLDPRSDDGFMAWNILGPDARRHARARVLSGAPDDGGRREVAGAEAGRPGDRQGHGVRHRRDLIRAIMASRCQQDAAARDG